MNENVEPRRRWVFVLLMALAVVAAPVLIHFGPNTFLGKEWGDGTASPSVFNPNQLDTGQWMRAIKSAGATYVVMVAKHHDGFCLWPTNQTDYGVKSSPWKDGKGDTVGEVAAAARKYGLKLGIYLSPWDRHEPRYSDSLQYDSYYLAEMGELIQNYGELVEWWLDGAGSAGQSPRAAGLAQSQPRCFA